MKARFWTVISLLCFLAAIGFWLKGNEVTQRRQPQPRPMPAPGETSQVARAAASGAAARSTGTVALLSRDTALPRIPAPAPVTAVTVASARQGDAPNRAAGVASPNIPDPKHPFRLRNTAATVDALLADDHAVLLRNALIDTRRETPVLPVHLRSSGDPGAYIVQARGAITDGFRRAIAGQGGVITAYLPNNAYLVRGDAAFAARLEALPVVQTVLPYEPYYKLAGSLIEAAVTQEPVPAGMPFNLTLFPGTEAWVQAALADAGAMVLAETRTPFGPRLTVQPAGGDLAALAGLPGVQLVEPHAERVLLNDLSRERHGVSTATAGTNENYLELTGSNVWVNVNDTGVDAEHPDLKGRVFGDTPAALTDPQGHGTHVAGTIASTGENSPDPDPTNGVPGSVSGANFRGHAPAASLFVMEVNRVTGPLISDTYLQETAARTNYLTLARTNPLVSNNSWGYRLQFDYDTAAASFDAATRDAVPDEAGSQSILYVFSAGNDGAGNGDGQGGEPGTISSPGTSKNGITVGGIDSPRFITNEVPYLIGDQLVTNAIWIGETDSNDEVAPFSSRGNVGLGIEGDAGRYKPDLVAPAAFVASTRAKDWTPRFMATNEVVNLVREQIVQPDVWNDYAIQVPANTTKLTIETLPGPNSPSPFPDLGIYARFGDFPDVPDYVADGRAEILSPEEGAWYYSIANTTVSNVNFNLLTRLEIVITEEDYLETLEELNEPLEPDYRFASGTSSAAANISGLLALIQEFFEVRLERSYTPALLKALLINRAHSLGPAYNFEVRNLVNYQGWGIPELPLVLPTALTNSTDEADWPVRWLDQSPTNAVATGEIQTYDLKLPEDVQQSDLRITLVWTDPPGNPAASIKLVNDLDLVLSNTVTGEYYVGNEIVADSDYNVAHLPPQPDDGAGVAPAEPGGEEDATNQVDQVLFDRVNNVENIFLRRPLDTNYVLQVHGRRVNVNAVTGHTNSVVQDFALVVSLTSTTNGFEFARTDDAEPFRPPVTTMTNGLPLYGQLVGANAPLIGTPVGVTNQWHFYTFTNTPMPELGGMTNNGPYVAFITFSPPEKAVLREDTADIELYVARDDSGLLNLDPRSIADSDKSLLRGGTEMVAYTNSYLGEIFYVGVKSEDMQAAEYSIVGLSSDEPFGTFNPDGSISLRGMGVPAPIPDGSPVKPGGMQVFAVGIYPGEVGLVSVSNLLYHESMGDLYTEIWHANQAVGLHNHASGNLYPDGILGGIYDDSQSGEDYDVLNADGPGTLLDFLGTRMEGPWIFSAVDNALSRTGVVQEVTVNVRPNPDLLEGYFDTVLPNQFRYYFIDVPADASLLTVMLSQMTGPLNVYLRRGVPPTLTDYDKMASLTPPGGELTLGTTDSPPLTAGRYYIGVFNPTAVAIDYFIKVRIDRDLSSLIREEYVSTQAVELGDDLRTTLTNTVDIPLTVTEVNVGLRVDHSRVSDLDFHLVSPDGTRLLLVEERGRTNLAQLGFDAAITNFQHVALTYDRGSGLAALYLDGELQAEEDIGDVRVDTRETLYLGERPVTNATSAAYRGTLDQVTLHTRALLPGEVRAITRYGGGGLPLDSLLSMWPFDGDAQDSVTNNHGTVEGATFVTGKFGQAVDFRLPDDRVVITNTSGLDVGVGQGFTLDGWINPANLASERTLAVWSNGTNTLGLELGIVPGTSTNVPPGRLFANLRDIAGADHVILSAEQGLILTNQVVTNTYYVTLTDNTNVAKVPIKFARPDTNLAFSLTNRLVSGLEPVAANPLALFADGEVFDGWTVVSNGPAGVFNSPQIADTGTNVMVLNRATLTRDIATRPDRLYHLSFSHRSQPVVPDLVAWWRGEGDALDSVGTNHGVLTDSVPFAPGQVGQGMSFEDDEGFVEVADGPGVTFTNELSIEFWFYARPAPFGGGLLGKLDDPTTEGVNYAVSLSNQGLDLWFDDPDMTSPDSEISGTTVEGIRIPAPSAIAWHHFVGTMRQAGPDWVELGIYLDGELQHWKELDGRLFAAATPGPLLLGTTLPDAEGFNGILDEVSLYRRVITAAEVTELHAFGPLGKAPSLLEPVTFLSGDGSTLGLVTSTNAWATNGFTFLAVTNVATVALVANVPGAIFDSFTLNELPNTTFLPEETLKPMLGQIGQGDWKLEVTDRRVGPTNEIDVPEVLSWQLQLTFGPPVIPAVTLTNGIPYTNNLALGEAAYFIVEVPRAATMATNEMTAGSGLDLWFNQRGVPQFSTNAASTDYLLLTNATGGLLVLSTNGTDYLDPTNLTVEATTPDPVLVPGQRYYLALTNLTAATQYTIEVTFDALDTNIFGLTDLPFATTISTNIAATNVMQFYRYTVTTNAYAASFEVLPSNGDVDLYVRRAEPVLDPLPTPFQHDYASENPGALPEIIVVDGNSFVPLTPGDWYLGVLNVDTQPVDYDIRVVEFSDNPAGIIDLVDGVSVAGTAAPGAGFTKFFRFTVSNSPPAIEFDLFNVSGSAQMLVKLDGQPAAFDFDFQDTASPGAPARLLIQANAQLPALDGEWYVAVLDQEPFPITYSIMAAEVDPTPVVTDLADGVALRGTIPADMLVPGFPARLEYYRFVVSPGAEEATFTLAPVNGNADLVLRRGLPLPTLGDHDYGSFQPGSTPDIIIVGTNSFPVPIAPGEWFAGVINQTTGSVTYTIRADERIGGVLPPITIIPVFDVSSGTVTLTWTTQPGLRFQVQYANTIPPDGVIVWIPIPGDITSADGNYQFVDDGSQTGGPAPVKFYRLVLVE